MFTPYSGGSLADLAALTIQSANRTFDLTDEILLATGNAGAESVGIEYFADNDEKRASANLLKTLFNLFGSDKSTHHNYHLLYGALLNPATTVNILEIGIGTNNTEIVSNMGAKGRPGASLRAFREFLPNATIYGADIDRGILFDDDRIKTFFVDQTDMASLDDLSQAVPDDLDLVIDDGLHCPDANLATLLFSLKKLRVGGWVVIEDIAPAASPLWRLIAAVLNDRFPNCLVSAKGGLMFVLQRKSD
jgi:hypothetical protein